MVGQPRAGKTTFIEYLQYGLFEDEKDTSKTVDHTSTPRFNVKLGKDAALELVVKSAVDIPGQWGAVKHADVAFDRNPHAIVIVLDSTSSAKGKSEASAAVWLTAFSRRLESHWRTEDSKRPRLKSILVLVNKIDKSTAAKVNKYKALFRNILDAELRDGRGKIKDEIGVLGCCGVTNPDSTKHIDSAIAHLAKQLAR